MIVQESGCVTEIFAPGRALRADSASATLLNPTPAGEFGFSAVPPVCANSATGIANTTDSAHSRRIRAMGNLGSIVRGVSGRCVRRSGSYILLSISGHVRQDLA